MDCNKTIDFFAEAKRLCDSRTACRADAANKERCPLIAFCGNTFATRSAEESITAFENLQKWSDEHPKKTYAQDFFEKFPNAQNYAGVNPVVCRKKIYGGFKNGDCAEPCYKCWNEPMNDEEPKGA